MRSVLRPISQDHSYSVFDQGYQPVIFVKVLRTTVLTGNITNSLPTANLQYFVNIVSDWRGLIDDQRLRHAGVPGVLLGPSWLGSTILAKAIGEFGRSKLFPNLKTKLNAPSSLDKVRLARAASGGLGLVVILLRIRACRCRPLANHICGCMSTRSGYRSTRKQ